MLDRRLESAILSRFYKQKARVHTEPGQVSYQQFFGVTSSIENWCWSCCSSCCHSCF